MTYLRRTFPITMLVLLTMVLAACGNSTSSGSGSTPTPAATTPTPAATTPTTTAALVMTTTATVKGQSVTILTDASSGKTLYFFTPDTATKAACTGNCAKAWPPLLATGSGTPTSATSLPGMLTVVSSGNGNQVAYNGHLLYTFSGDSGPAQTNGEGVGGKWFVCTPDLAVGNGSSSGALIKTATVTVQGQSVTVLTNASSGKTLYYFTPDTATTSACTGGCASAWPPLLATGSGTPTSSTSLPGKLTVVKTANGNQVEYNGHLLYTFSGDSGPAQSNGEGVGNKWFVVTADLK